MRNFKVCDGPFKGPFSTQKRVMELLETTTKPTMKGLYILKCNDGKRICLWFPKLFKTDDWDNIPHLPPNRLDELDCIYRTKT